MIQWYSRLFACVIAITCLMFMACNETSSSGDALETPGGYAYNKIVDVDGETPLVGDFVFFDLTVTSGDSLVQSSHTKGDPFQVKIMEDNKMYAAFTPVIDMIRTMSPGDSSILFFPRDSFANRGAGMEQFADIIEYQVALKEIKTADAFKVYQDSVNQIRMQEAQVVAGRLPDVESFANDFYNDYKSNRLGDKIISKPSGLKYVIHDEGNTARPIDKGSFISTYYYGTLEKDNSLFDTSFKQGFPLNLTVGIREVIAGWDEGTGRFELRSKSNIHYSKRTGLW